MDANLIGHVCMLAGSLGWVGLCVACLLLDRSGSPKPGAGADRRQAPPA
jgi:hypothetical protein